jgi:AraC family transcriptional regulator
VYERSLLPSCTAGSATLPLAWIEAVPHEARADIVIERPVLVMIDRGSVQLDCGFGLHRLSCDLQAGSIGYFTPGTQIQASRWRWSGTRRIAIDLQQAEVQAPGLSDLLRRAPASAEVEFHDGDLEALMRGMAREAAEGCPHGPLFAEGLMIGLSMRLEQRATARFGTVRERGRLSGAQCRLLQDHVRAHLNRPVTVASLARIFGYSPSQFVRVLKNSTGLTPHQYVMQFRLEVARALVLHGSRPLVAIAEDTGFASQSHMTTAFTRRFGVPPGELRRNAHADRLQPALVGERRAQVPQ